MQKQTEERDGFATGRGIRLHYVERGPADGFPVVLLPGWPQTAYTWRHAAPLLAKAGYRTLSFDLPGQDTSDLLSEGTPYETRRIADIIHDALRSIGVPQIHLVAHDVGAWVAFAFCTLYPDFVSSATMIESQIIGISPMPEVSQAPRAFQYFLNGVPGLGEMLTAGHEREFLNFLFRHKLGRQEAISEADLEEYMRTYGNPKCMSAGFEYYRAVPANTKLDAKVPALTMPVFVLGAEKGVGNTFLEAMKPHANKISGALLEGYGHYLPEEAPELLCKHILHFFSEVESPTTVYPSQTQPHESQ